MVWYSGEPRETRAQTATDPAPRQPLDLFVVHAASDAAFVHGYLLPALDVPASRRLLLDELTPGALVIDELERGVASRLIIIVLSPACLEDRWTVVGEQLASYLSLEGVHVVPLQLASCELPVHLKARVSLDFTDRAYWDAGVARLRELLHTTAPGRDRTACPYPGMRPFAADEASQLCGRTSELDDLVRRLDRGEREIYVIGPSGSGKSSLVQAGLLPRLRSGSRLGSFVVCETRPGERPAERLEKVLEGELTRPAATVGALLARHPPAERVLVFIDQLEELFTLAAASERQRFVATLRAVRTEPRCHLLLALRADFFGALMDSALWPDRTRPISRLEVAPLRGAALAQAITEPALRAGVHVEPRLCDQLVADADDEPGALPLVQETLRILWDKRRQRLLGLAEYEALGDGRRGLDVAIGWHADATMRQLTLAQQAIARRILLRLVSFGEGRPDTRRQQEVEALRSAADDETEFSCVLQHLVDSRLITVTSAAGADPARAPSHEALVDLAHEALITAWPVLREWIAGRRADEQRRRRIERRVSEWIDRGRATARLLDPVELAEATRWIDSDAARELGYGPDLQALVAASRRELEDVERQARARRRFLAMTYLDQGRALLLGGRPMQALPYLMAARAENIESPVLRMLFAQASRNLPLVTFVGHGALVRKAVFSPDGRRVVTASWDHTAQVWDAATGKPLTPALAHRNVVLAAAFSPDGMRVVTASKDGTARVWDAVTGGAVAPALAHGNVVHTAAFSPDGKKVVTASSDRTARIWDAATGAELTRPLEHHDSVYAAAFSADASRAVTASYDKTARIWDTATGVALTPPLRHHAGVLAAAFSPDGTRVVTASHDHTARIWSAATGRPVTSPLVHHDIVAAALFSPDGARVVTASYDRTARVWDASTGKPVTPPLEHHGIVSAAVFSPDGARVVTASYDKTARIWSAATGKPETPPLEHHGDVRAAAFDPGGTQVITASGDRTARIWDASTSTSLPLVHRDTVVTAAFSASGGRVVTGSDDKTARVWDLSTGQPGTRLVHRGAVQAAAFSPDGARVVTASWDKTAQIWDAATGAPLTPPLVHQGAVWTAAFSPDGTRVVTASWDTTARVWDASTGGAATPPLEHEGAVRMAAFSPDGRHVVTAGWDHSARIWHASTGVTAAPPLGHGGMVSSAAFSADGTRLVTASVDTTARVWDAATGAPVTPALDHQNVVHAAAFNLDGTRVVTASRDGTARVWDAGTGKPVTPPLEHQDEVHAAAFSPDGTRVVTASCDRTARIWDASTGKPVTPPFEHRDAVHAAAFSPDGTRVVTASRDGTARVWSLPTDAGSLDDWRVLARCSPFALVDNVLTTNPDPTRCVPAALRPSPARQAVPPPRVVEPEAIQPGRASRDRPARPAHAPPARARGCRRVRHTSRRPTPRSR